MGKEELYEILDMESGDDFRYFENMAELLESDEELEEEVLYDLLEDIDLEVFAELADEYFDQMQEAVPDSETDFYTLLENIKRSISVLAYDAASDDDDQIRSDQLLRLSEELAKFREWYNETGEVVCRNVDTGESQVLPVRDALVLDRAEQLGGPAYELDLEQAMEYDLDDFVMSLEDRTDE